MRARPLAFSLAVLMAAALAGCNNKEAASPTPGASSIVSIMSATSRLISGAPGSGTGSQWRSRTGCPMRAIFKMAIHPAYGRLACRRKPLAAEAVGGMGARSAA